MLMVFRQGRLPESSLLYVHGDSIQVVIGSNPGSAWVSLGLPGSASPPRSRSVERGQFCPVPAGE